MTYKALFSLLMENSGKRMTKSINADLMLILIAQKSSKT